MREGRHSLEALGRPRRGTQVAPAWLRPDLDGSDEDRRADGGIVEPADRGFLHEPPLLTSSSGRGVIHGDDHQGHHPEKVPHTPGGLSLQTRSTFPPRILRMAASEWPRWTMPTVNSGQLVHERLRMPRAVSG